MTDDVQNKVVEIIAEQAMIDAAEVKLGASPEDLGLDSLGMVEVVFGIEEAFDISVPFNANDPTDSEFDISTVDHIVKAVQTLVDAQKA